MQALLRAGPGGGLAPHEKRFPIRSYQPGAVGRPPQEAGPPPEEKVHFVPENIDRETARLKFKVTEIQIDVLTREQKACLASWEAGI